MPRPIWGDLNVAKGIGNGAGSLIYIAKDENNGQVLAVKHVTRAAIEHIERTRAGNAEIKLGRKIFKSFFDQVKNEYAILKKFQAGGGSPGIVRVHELRTVRKNLRFQGYDLIMEYIEGVGLKDDNTANMPQLLDYFRQASQALVDLHHSGYVHADMKPAHIIITPGNLVKLIDFGQSCSIDGQRPRIQGTPEYMAPEQLKGDEVDFRTDVYGMGSSMYWGFTGRLNRPALTGTSGGKGGMDFTVSFAGRSRSVRNDNPKVPKQLDHLIVACCERRPDKRPQSIREVWEEIVDISKKGILPGSV